MNTYVMGEIAALLVVTAVAGILIGWCIKSLLSGRFENQVRANVARDVDEAAADVEQMRINLQKKDSDLQGAMLELQQLRGRDVSLSKLQELQSVSNELASFKTGGSVHDKSMNQAHDSIAALRAAARENDKIIESLRARNKEADTTVENLRSQLKQSEVAQHEAISSRQEHERATARLTASLQDASGNLEKQKRDYNTMLESKNQDIAKQMGRLEELGSVQSLLKQKEHDLKSMSLSVNWKSVNRHWQIPELALRICRISWLN